MKFICDVNVSYGITKWLQNRSGDAQHVNKLFTDPETPDNAIIELAVASEAIVVTHDSDFQISYNVYKKPRQIIFLKTKNIIDSQLKYLFEKNWTSFEDILKKHPVCLIEVHSIEEWYYFTHTTPEL